MPMTSSIPLAYTLLPFTYFLIVFQKFIVTSLATIATTRWECTVPILISSFGVFWWIDVTWQSSFGKSAIALCAALWRQHASWDACPSSLCWIPWNVNWSWEAPIFFENLGTAIQTQALKQDHDLAMKSMDIQLAFWREMTILVRLCARNPFLVVRVDVSPWRQSEMIHMLTFPNCCLPTRISSCMQIVNALRRSVVRLVPDRCNSEILMVTVMIGWFIKCWSAFYRLVFSSSWAQTYLNSCRLQRPRLCGDQRNVERLQTDTQGISWQMRRWPEITAWSSRTRRWRISLIMKFAFVCSRI